MADFRCHAVGKRSESHLPWNGRRRNNSINGNFNAAYTCVVTAAEKAAGISCPQSAAIIPGSISTANPTGIAINNQSILGTSSPAIKPARDLRSVVDMLVAHQFVNGNCFAAQQ